MQLGEHIYQYRSQKGLSQGALASALEVSRQSVSKWENNSSVPELDKLIKMSELFEITLDELVFGKKEEPTKPIQNPLPAQPPQGVRSVRTWIGSCLLMFGMIFFLLSIFWGDQLRFGEEFGELVSLSIVLISIALVATYNAWVLGTCAVIYFLYSIVCIGILNLTSLTNYAFMSLASLVIFVWFLLWGFHHTKAHQPTGATLFPHF